MTCVGALCEGLASDELPQFWNVLRGEMSLVGPCAEQPELVAEYQRQVPFYRARLLVKPGLTGWAQINYGYVASVTETAVEIEYDAATSGTGPWGWIFKSFCGRSAPY